MTRNEYVERVLSVMRNATTKEQEAVRAEIDAHIEDHICDLLELDYDEALAEERTMALMGDPEEVGRELDKQYPLRWLVLGTFAAILSVCMGFLLALLLAVGEPSMVKALSCRWQPETYCCLTHVETEAAMDLRYTMGNDVVRVYQVYVGELDGQRMAMVNLDDFDRLPLGAAAPWTEYTVLENQQGNSGRGYWENGLRSRFYSPWCDHACLGVPVEPEDTYVTLRCERYGESLDCRIPLPKEGTP